MAMASMSSTTLPYWSTRITDPNPPYQFNHPISSSSSSSSSQLKLFSSSFNHHHNLSSQSVNTRFPVCYNNNNDRGGSKLDNSSSDNDDEEEWNQGWDYAIQEAFKSAIKKFDGYLSSYFNRSKLKKSDDGDIERESKGNGDGEVEDWDWERWQKHFIDIDEQERIVSTLESQLAKAVNKEDYEEAARLKVAIAAAAANDSVGQVMAYLNKAVKEERYGDAAALRDYAGTGLVGWWAGISEDADDPYGCIISISAEYGRYVARSYSPRQLATAMEGAPLFEIFFTTNMKGEYKQQVVYLNRRKDPPNLSIASSTFDSLGPTENKGDLLEESTEDTVDSGEDEDSSLENTLRDLIPGVKVKVLKVTTPGKVDSDLISKVVEQIIDEEDEEQDFDLESGDIEEDNNDENGEEQNDIVLDANTRISDGDDDQTQVAINVVLDGLVTTFPSSPRHGDLLRVPASLEKRNHMSFTFTVEGDDDKHMSSIDGKASSSKKAKVQSQRSADRVMLDLAKSIGKGKIPMKVLRDVGELINLTISQARNRQPLSGSTKFSRIDVPGTRDLLNGLYIGAHGLYTSEVIQLRRRFGQWKEDGRAKESPNLEFYEYVEATKITGNPYVPAGQIAFRAKIGKRYQLPHKGIIPEEFGVIARYKGQGRLAEPGFRNPRWVDGELVILDGKYIKAGPVVGFVYWAPEYQFLMFFNRLRLQM